jgi:hypothetical protein
MAKTINFPTISYFGGCPKCGGNDGYLNVIDDQYCVCDRYRYRWYVGRCVFDDWREEDEEIWADNLEKLKTYTPVEPVFSVYASFNIAKYGQAPSFQMPRFWMMI